ncbi:hypothetical protein UlMin_045165 [Ulmus minor]
MAQTSTMENLTTETPENLTTETLKKKLFDSVMQQKWNEVAEIYKDSRAHTITITHSGETALHLAISDPKSENKVENVKKLVRHIKKEDRLEVLNLQTEKGNTPLHSAAETGLSGKTCKSLIESVSGVNYENALKLVRARCKKGESPLFKAVHYDRLGSFFYLHSIIREHFGENFSNFERNDGQSILDDPIIRSILVRDDGQSILHDAIIRKNFALAFYIIQLYKDLVNHVDNQGESPLHALARKPAAFKSGKSLHGWVDSSYINITNLLPTRSQHNIFNTTSLLCYSPSQRRHYFIPFSYIVLTKEKLFMREKSYYFSFIFEGDAAVRKIYAEKEKHIWADQVLNELLKHATMYDKKGSVHRPGHGQQSGSDEGSDEGPIEGNISPSERLKLSSLSVAGKDESSKIEMKDTAILIAAKCGIVEMVKRIIDKFPVAIYDAGQERKNLLLVALENRHLKIYELLLKKYPPKCVIFQKVDINGNTALHFAARYSDSVRSWPVPGAALQMQWEIKWLEFVEKTMPPRLFFRTNTNGETPSEIFSNDHEPLVKAGGEWLVGTATSCSVVAALIVTIAYASSTTVPRGTDSDSGKPKLRQIPTFELFAIASLAALCFSVTSLITFLSILTSRHEEKDFDKNLPRKILLGLSSLFASIAAMLVTFSAGHFLVFEDKFNYAAFPVYAVTFLPLCLFAAAQFPLYIDIFRASFWNPF